MSDNLTYQYGDKTILELMNLWEGGHLNLEPGFQRQSVWSVSDRQKLIQSLLEGYPIPSIFLYRREEDGMPVYDVIDGKQRLETIFMFIKAPGFSRNGFDVRFRFSEDDQEYWYQWKDLKKWHKAASFLSNKIQTVDVIGDLGSIINLFVRINSTGKALTSAEKRNARYYESDFLRHAEKLAKRFDKYLQHQKIVSRTQAARLKDVELMSELLASVINGGPINKKTAVDRAVGNIHHDSRTLNKHVKEVVTVMNHIRRIFPNLRFTRFRNIAEFYSLFLVMWEMWQSNVILTNKKHNELAERILTRLSNGVDEVRDMQARLQTGKEVPRLFADYLLTVQQSTDALLQRKRRAEILRGLLGSVFLDEKDTRRIFSPEQRRLLWNSDAQPKCNECQKKLDWNNFQVDHLKPHSRGGSTTLSNGALICRSCNASKGARKSARKAS